MIKIQKLQIRVVTIALLLTCLFLTISCKHEPIATDAWPPAERYLAQQPATHHGISLASRYLTMRDGVKIAVDVSLPKELQPGEKIPTIIRQTRYWRSTDLGWPLRLLAEFRRSTRKLFVTHGYAWVDVDVRGTGASFGHWAYPFSPDEIRDGAEIVDWIVRQPWSNGKVGTMGISYDGSTAEFLLADKHSAVKAAALRFSLFDAYTDIAFPGGVLNSWFLEGWTELNRAQDSNLVPKLFTMPWWSRPFFHGVRPVDGDQGRSLRSQAVREHVNNMDVHAMALQVTYRDDVPPAGGVSIDAFSPFKYAADIDASGAAIYAWAGWLDGAYQDAAIKRYLTLKNPARLIIGPWNHGGGHDSSPFSPSHTSAFVSDGELLRFFDYYLKSIDNGMLQDKSILYFTMGEEKWKSADTWPLRGTQTVSFYLEADHRLSPTKAALAEASDSYLVDATAGTGNTSRWNTQLRVGDVVYPDRKAADEKLLHYTSTPLDSDMEVTGNPIVNLFVASTATDGEFFAYLEDVDGRGQVNYVTEGELRAIQRKLGSEPPPYRQVWPYHSYKRQDALPLAPGEIAQLTFKMLATSYLFKRGHAIRLALAGADRDHFAVLPGPTPILQYHRDIAHPSRIDLPVVPR